MIEPGGYVTVDGKLSIVIAHVPEDRYVLVLESDTTRLRQLSQVEYMLVGTSEAEKQVGRK